MPITNSQYDAIMRSYDAIRTKNQHIQAQRYEEVTSLCPEFADIENEIISLSIKTATSIIRNDSNSSDSVLSHTSYKEQINALNRKKIECLIRLGKPVNYLNEIYTCPKCHDTGYINGHKCPCFKKKAIDLVYKDSNLKNITENENFDTFSYEWYDDTNIDTSIGLTPFENMQIVTSICHSFIDNFDTDFSNLLFYGNTGVGKTFLSNCIAKELLNTSHSVIYLTAIELFQKFEANDFNKSYQSDVPFNSNYILDCDLLIIDDLGTENGNTYTNSRLFYCINERILRKKSVIISTNLTLQEIKDTYSERILSRLVNSYKFLRIVATDIRTLKHTLTK